MTRNLHRATVGHIMRRPVSSSTLELKYDYTVLTGCMYPSTVPPSDFRFDSINNVDVCSNKWYQQTELCATHSTLQVEVLNSS